VKGESVKVKEQHSSREKRRQNRARKKRNGSSSEDSNRVPNTAKGIASKKSPKIEMAEATQER
jgi:hypothetical protein